MTARIPFTPGQHQLDMIEHAWEHPRCGLWAGMGTGKTSATLTLLHNLELVEPGRSLVLGPKRVAKNTWPREAAKWEHLRGLGVVPVVGTEKERIAALSIDASIHTINYDVLPWLIEWHVDNKKTWRWSRVAADESTRLKNFRIKGKGGSRARAIGRVAHTNVRRWINLTGTPAPNGLKDLWGQTWFLDAGVRLGRTLKAFQDRWFAWQRRPDPTNPQSQHEIQQVPLPYAQEQIQGVLADICFTPEVPFDVDAPIRRIVYADMPGRARTAYRQMERELYTEIAGSPIEALTAATKTMKLLQMASGFVWEDASAAKRKYHAIHEEKIAALESIVEEANGESILVEYHWVPSKEAILRAFPKARFLDDDPRTEDDWNEGKIPMLVANAASAGHGLNLQDGGRILARYDHWWDLETYDQILERIGPMRQVQAGHPRAVYDYHIVARDTVDEDVMYRRETKREVQDILLESMKRRNG